jgi:hypothetical protein
MPSPRTPNGAQNVRAAVGGLQVDLHRAMIGAVVVLHHGSLAASVRTEHLFGTVVGARLAR